MKAFKFIYIVLIIFCPLIMSSCKKSGREIVEKIATETTEKTAKGIAKEISEKTLKTLTKKELRSIDWKDLMKLIKKKILILQMHCHIWTDLSKEKLVKPFNLTMTFIQHLYHLIA